VSAAKIEKKLWILCAEQIEGDEALEAVELEVLDGLWVSVSVADDGLAFGINSEIRHKINSLFNFMILLYHSFS